MINVNVAAIAKKTLKDNSFHWALGEVTSVYHFLFRFIIHQFRVVHDFEKVSFNKKYYEKMWS